MTRMGLCVMVILAGVGPLHAHYYYLLPPDGPQQPVRVVFSDTAQVDPSVDMPTTPGHFWVVGSPGGTDEIQPQAGGAGWLALPAGAASAREVFGTVEAGVPSRGQPDAALVVHHPKLVRTLARTESVSPQPMPAGLELSPVIGPGGVAFVLTAGGRKLAATEVVVYPPDEKRPRVVKTNAEGVTPRFEVGGRYAARAYLPEAKGGEFQGRKYTQIRHYATLVVQVDKAP